MSFLPNSLIPFALLLGAFLCLPRLTPCVFSYLLCSLGRFIRSRTAAKNELIVSQVRAEEEEWRSKQTKTSPGTTLEDEDWEKVDNNALASAGNGEPGDDEWDGIIGFFHPFWYGVLVLIDLSATVN
jgi:alpha-1,2-mannosyltransferase